jgi:glycosyltransferase involved in cell wall biosynthesis
MTVCKGYYKNNELVCKALKDEKYFHIHIGDDITKDKCRSKLFKNYSNLTYDELNIVYNFADVYVRPTKQEGFGLPSIEFGTLGIPVVLSDIEVNHEIMGNSAIYIKNFYDVKSIRDAIEVGLSDNQTIKHFNKEYYSNEMFVKRMTNYIHKIN